MAVIFIEELEPKFPLVFRTTLGGSDVATEFTLPPEVRRVSLRFETNVGKFAFDGTDAVAIDSNYGEVSADTWYDLDFSLTGKPNTARPKIYLASATGSTVVQILIV